MGHRPRGFGDDVRVAGIGLRIPGVQVRDPAHRQTGQILHRDAHRLGHRDRQRADAGGLVDHDHQFARSPNCPNSARSAASSLAIALSYSRLPARSNAVA